MIFDYISDILFTKNKKSISNIDTENEFSPYLLNRWLSMYSTQIAKYSNAVNKYLTVFNKQELYNLFVCLFPKVPNKKITYFKRTKEDKESEETVMYDKIAAAKELSVREIKDYIRLLNYIER